MDLKSLDTGDACKYEQGLQERNDQIGKKFIKVRDRFFIFLGVFKSASSTILAEILDSKYPSHTWINIYTFFNAHMAFGEKNAYYISRILKMAPITF